MMSKLRMPQWLGSIYKRETNTKCLSCLHLTKDSSLFEQQRIQMVKQVFTKEFFPKGIGSKTRTPIFIIGFVQSGSTLLERILDAHPLLVGAGEDSVFNGSLDYILNEIVAANQAGDLSILHSKVKKLADDVVIDMIKRWEI